MSASVLAILAEDPVFGPAQFALPAADNVTECSSSLSPLAVRSGIETVGTAYHGLVFPATSEDAGADAAEAAEANAEENDRIYARVQECDIEDYYGLLNLAEKNLDATDEEIKASYRKLSLLCHPDKAAPERREEAEARFKSMQKGFDVLTNPSTRIDYDSMYEVDDDIPGPKEGAGDIAKFLAVYGPVFARNARFSTVKPVPLIGNADTPYAEVEKFYLFWGNFKSWREFASGDTDKCGDSASRDERRRAAQKNKKQREVLKKEELGRIRKLMTQAQAIDPRVVAHKSAIANNKSAAKNAAADAKRIAAEEAKRAVDEAKKAAEEAAAKAKQAADEARRKAADLSNKIRKFRAVFNREPELSGEEGLVNQMLKIMELPEGIVIDKALKAAGVVVDANGFGGDVVGKVACLECVKALADRARPLLVKA